MIAEFERFYPGLFQGGSLAWRYFWALAEQIRPARARERREAMYAHLYGALQQSSQGQKQAMKMLRETQREAEGVINSHAQPDDWDALTAEGRRRLRN